MRSKVFASVVSTILLASTVFSTAVMAETNKNVSGPLTKEQITTIGKDYVKPNLKGEWIYNKADDTFTWSLKWERITYAKAYKIYRKAEGEEEYKLLTKIDKEKTLHYVDASFEYGKVYTYKFNYIHGNREIELSDEITVDYALDSDGDGLYDILEFKQGSDASISDTDGDGLSDGYEAIGTRTNFLKTDTDDNGIADGIEDLDGDGLDNLKEKDLNINPRNEDTDTDKSSDGDEVAKSTNPSKSDTDGDGLEDGFEPTVNLNPLKKDTDDDGVLDGDEKVEVSTRAEDNDENVQPSVIIQSNASEADSTTIVNFEGEYSSLDESLPGYIGAPYEFHTDVDFETAKMQFSYDKSLNGDNFKPAIFYFNEETQMLEKVENQTIDTSTGTVSADVSHFSVYLLLNEEAWEEAWAKEMKTPIIGEDGNTQYIDVVFAIDSSGSMSWNDPDELRKEAAKSFIDKLRELDQAAVVDFDDYARTLVSLTTDHEKVKVQIDTIDDSGGTNLYAGLNKAVDEVKKGPTDHKRFIIFLTDGDGTWSESALNAAKANNVTVYTIGLGSSLNQSLLQRIATETGGKYFHATNANELGDIHDEVADETVSSKDTDKDGLADVTEEKGFRTETGAWITTDPNKADTDGDGLSDGEEAGDLRPGVPGTSTTPYYYTKSNPKKKDTDDDGLHDNVPKGCNQIADVTDCKDTSPKKYNVSGFIGSLISEISYVNMESLTSGGKRPKMEDLTGNVVTQLDNRINHNLADRDTEDANKDWDAAKRYLKGWKLIKAEDSGGWDVGLGAMALKKGNTVVIGYRGSEGIGGETDVGEILKDWVAADLGGIGLFGTNLQMPGARDFAYDVIMNNPDSNVYVMGHSLGGFIAQAVSYDIIEEKIDNAAFWFYDEWKMQDILDNNPNIFKKGLTYNAAPFLINMSPASMLFRAVPLLDAASSKYDDKIYNYSIESDPLSESVFTAKIAVRVGRDIPMLPYDGPDKFAEAHSLKYFYNHFQ